MKRLIFSFFWILLLSGSILANNKCESVKVHTWDNCVGNYQLSDASSYTGFFKSGRFDGQGVLNYSNGNKYQGQFKSGKRNGLGLFSYYNGSTFLGNYLDNEKSGFGIFTYKNGGIFYGNWHTDKKNGHGALQSSDKKLVGIWKDNQFLNFNTLTCDSAEGSSAETCFGSQKIEKNRQYLGYIKGEERNGFGSILFLGDGPFSGDVFMGMFEKDQASGQGLYIFNNGNQFVGTYKSNESDGYGIYVNSNKSKYFGGVLGGSYHGLGNLTLPNGDNYQGEFKYGKIEGKGDYIWSNGDTYSGKWFQEKKHGFGTYRWVNGDTYVGMYRDGFQNGIGVFTFLNGDSYVGEFESGNRSGKGKYTWANGTYYNGMHWLGKEEGVGTRVYINGDMYTGDWKAGKYHGNGVLTQAGEKISGRWEANKFIKESKDLKRIALLIGNYTYKNETELLNPANDVRDLSKKLKEIGFDVSSNENLTDKQMELKIASFGEKAKNSDIALFYFSGHGIEIGGQNYMIPVDARMNNESSAKVEAINLDLITDMTSKSSKLGIVLIDACRNNPFLSRMLSQNKTKSISKGLAEVDTRENLIISFAAAAGNLAMDGPVGGNSPYAKALLKYIGEREEIGMLFRKVGDEVRELTDNTQRPMLKLDLSGEKFFLVK